MAEYHIHTSGSGPYSSEPSGDGLSNSDQSKDLDVLGWIGFVAFIIAVILVISAVITR